MKFLLRILHLEDDPKDAELIQAMLETEGIICHVTRVETQADFLALIEQGVFDIILADHTLPSFDGLSALKITQEKCPDIPFIFVSGTLGEELAIEALKSGATDYVLKERLSRIVPSVRRALREAKERIERKRAEEALRESLAQLYKKNRYETIISAVTRSVHQSINLQEVLENAVDAMSKNIEGVDNVSIYLVKGEEAVLRAYRGYPDQFVKRLEKIPYPKGITWKTIIEEKFIYCADVDQDIAIGPAGREAGIKSYASMPIFFEGKAVGAINITSLQKNAFDEEELRLLEVVAQQIGVAINNAKQTEALRQSEERYRALYENNPLMCFTLDTEGTVLSVNQFGAEQLGYTVEGLVGQPVLNVFHEDDKKSVPEQLNMCLQNPTQIFQWELRKIHKNGRVLWVKEVARVMQDTDGSAVLLIVCEDITERKQAEEALQKALRELEQLKNRLQAENVYLQEEIKTEYNFEEIVGESTSLKNVLRNVEKVAPTDATILIQGETGTGKELIARAIHNLSPRKDRPLVKVNCGAISAGLVESELFGHEKGAFTGAVQQRIGRFELANGGTIFLDEVAELPPDTQVKLLRVLQEGEFERVGSSKPIKVNVRVIAATNRNLKEAVKAGSFRSDLFYRLSVFPLEVPPLRERKSDIPILANFFLTKFTKDFGKRIRGISHKTMDFLTRYSWPGNIRELQNVIERAVVLALAHEPIIQIDESMFGLDEGLQSSDSERLEDVERSHILRVLEETNWVINGKRGAASVLGLDPGTLRFRMKKLGIKRPERST